MSYLANFEDGSGDPKTLTVNREQSTDGITYIELELETRDDWGETDCYHSFLLSGPDALALAQKIQQVYGM